MRTFGITLAMVFLSGAKLAAAPGQALAGIDCSIGKRVSRGSCSLPFPPKLKFAGYSSCIDFFGDAVTYRDVQHSCKNIPSQKPCPQASITLNCGQAAAKGVLVVTHYYAAPNEVKDLKAKIYNDMLQRNGCPAPWTRCP